MGKAKTQDTPITELFKQFCKERHAEDKGKNYNLLQEVYSKAELFDMSMLDDSTKLYPKDFMLNHSFEGKHKEELVIHSDYLKNLALPFEVVFCKLPSENGTVITFMREYAPMIITGIVSAKTPHYELNSPFKIDLENSTMHLSMYGIYKYANVLRTYGIQEQRVEEYVKIIVAITLSGAFCSLYRLSHLPSYSTARDLPKKHDYYPRKKLSTIKVLKPIYYVLDKSEEKTHNKYNRIKPVGSIAFDHSFKVRGHWRTIDSKTYGKDRQGIYQIVGYTWVKEHVRGEGDLVRKLRVVK